MEKEKKSKLDGMIEAEIENRHFPGFLLGVKSESGEESFSYGTADVKPGLNMEKNTIFRLYSMSKPVCAVAVWILIERGKLTLDDFLSDYLPEFQNMVRYEEGKIIPVQNPIRIRDLLNMTAGFTYDDEDVSGKKTGEMFAKIHQGIDRGSAFTTREVMKMLAEIPLSDEPGRWWRYGLCADVLGAVIEAVDGRRLGEFYRQEIFEPLGMKDTGFYVPSEKQHRFAPLFSQKKKDDGTCVLEYDREYHLGLGDFLSPPAFESAGAGLVSTYDDYMKFAWMLACGGELNGTRILTESTVASFEKNQLTDRQTKEIYYQHLGGYGYGNLMRVCLDPNEADVVLPKGSFGWDGWCGPFMTVDMEHKKTLLFFVQIGGYSNWKLTTEILSLFM